METNTQSYPKKKKHPIREMFFLIRRNRLYTFNYFYIHNKKTINNYIEQNKQ
jgi:hypothetical protein